MKTKTFRKMLENLKRKMMEDDEEPVQSKMLAQRKTPSLSDPAVKNKNKKVVHEPTANNIGANAAWFSAFVNDRSDRNSCSNNNSNFEINFKSNQVLIESKCRRRDKSHVFFLKIEIKIEIFT